MLELYEKPRKDHVTGKVTSWRDKQVADMKLAVPVLAQSVDLTKWGIDQFKVSYMDSVYFQVQLR